MFKGVNKGKQNGDMMAMMSMMMGMGMMGGGKGGKGNSKAGMKRAKGEKCYTGTLRYWNAEKNSGFIYCKEIMAEHGMEVYAYRNILEECNAGVGDDIAFFLHWSGKGQAQASSPALKTSSAVENNLCLKGTFRKPQGKDFGFIDCFESQDFFGKDIYVPANLCDGINDGQIVACNVYFNKEGFPNANIICACQQDYEPQPGDLSYSHEIQMNKGFGKGDNGSMPPQMLAMMKGMGMDPSMMMGKMGMGKGKGPGPYGRGTGGPAKKPTPTGQFMTGTVKKFYPEYNYGFISSDDVKVLYGGDVFCGGKDLSTYEVGASVMFQLALTEDQKPQAIDVTPA